MVRHRILAAAAIIGAVASVVAAGLFWLVATHPAALGVTLGILGGTGR